MANEGFGYEQDNRREMKEQLQAISHNDVAKTIYKTMKQLLCLQEKTGSPFDEDGRQMEESVTSET